MELFLKHKKPLLAALAILAMQSSFGQPVPTKQARDKGISTCLKKIDQIASFLVKEIDHHSNATWATNQPDQRLFNSQIIIKYSDGAGLAVMNVAPTRAGKCDASYSRVLTFDKSCISVRETTYRDWKFGSSGLFVGAFWPSDSGPSADLTLALARVDAPSAHQSCPALRLLVSS